MSDARAPAPPPAGGQATAAGQPVIRRFTSSAEGIACMVIGGLVLTVNDAIVKYMAGLYPVGEVMFIRGATTVGLIALYVAWRGGWPAIRVKSWQGQLARAACTLFSTFLFIGSLRFLPLAESIAITFAGPLFITALAARTLGEEVGWRRWAAVVVGFMGVLLMFRPGEAAFNWGAALALTAALSGAIRDLITRRITQTESSLSILMVTTATVTLGGLATLPLGWTLPSVGHGGLLMLAGVFLGTAHFLMIEAFRRAEATLVAPFKYVTVLWAVIAGVLVWGDWPDAWMGAGMVLVVGSGLYIFHRETRARPHPR